MDIALSVNGRNWPGLSELLEQGRFHADMALLTNGEINLDSTDYLTKSGFHADGAADE